MPNRELYYQGFVAVGLEGIVFQDQRGPAGVIAGPGVGDATDL